MSLFAQIGEEKLREIITEFYHRAFVDPIIAHFFFKHNHLHLIEQQFAFTASMLGATHIDYQGKSLRTAHQKIPLRNPHFSRRQVILAQVMDDLGLSESLKTQWLEKEEKLRPQIVHKII